MRADELAKIGAKFDGAEYAEFAAKDAHGKRKEINAAIRYGATFQCDVEDLVGQNYQGPPTVADARPIDVATQDRRPKILFDHPAIPQCCRATWPHNVQWRRK